MDSLNLHKQQLFSDEFKNLEFGGWQKAVEHIKTKVVQLI